jgi:DNA-binding NtrC family response regulator
MRLMIVGDLEGQLAIATNIAANRGAQVNHYANADVALDALNEGKGADLVMIAVQEDIARFIFALRSQRISVPVVACGIARDKEAAVRAIKAGAKEYIPLPPDEELIAAVLQAITHNEHNLLYRSEAMERVVSIANQIAPSDATVLITGESGTGKEVIARYIHQHSKRSDKPFISVNCAAIPENLLESELFGHEKGAFTGALGRRVGKFEEADKGTLLLDEISEMDLKLQAKLLRALQEREIDRVGGAKPIKIDIRIIATSNRDMMKAIRIGTFREDLYYRLNVINLALPPLRERTDDIIPLCEHFIEKYSKANNIPVRKLNEEAKQKLLEYHFSGNVRELENMMHRSILMNRSHEITPDAIILPNDKPKASEALKNTYETEDDDIALLVGRTVADVERDLILKTLDHCLGNRTHAANILGISIRTLRNKLRLYDDPRFE